MLALQALYEADMARHAADAVLKRHLAEFNHPDSLRQYAAELVNGIMQEREALDQLIGALAPEFPPEHLSPIDRNILRIALYEMRRGSSAAESGDQRGGELGQSFWQRVELSLRERRVGRGSQAMNGTILGIGPLEVLVIGILILLVFGPERLPEFARGLGKALRRLRETYVAFTQEFKGDLQPIAQDLDEVTRELRQEVQAIREAADLRAVLQPYANDINRNLTVTVPANAPPALPAPNGHVAAPASPAAPPRSDGACVTLPDDNPWASVGAAVRSDRLDDDNPWLSLSS